jgi:hypothetical protein
MLEVNRLEPLHVTRAPGVASFWAAKAAPKEKLSDAMASSKLILLRCLASSDQVAKGLMRRIGHPNRREVAAAVEASKTLGVTPIRLHAIARLHRDQRGGDDVARDT